MTRIRLSRLVNSCLFRNRVTWSPTMADSDSYSYRVKFTDIRVRPPGKARPRPGARYKAPPLDELEICEHGGCDEPGNCKSPKHGGGFYNFCQRHAAEYNKNWNFFDGMTEAEVKEFNEAAKYGHKKTWKFGTGPVSGKGENPYHDPRKWKGREFFEEGGSAQSPRQARGRTRLETKALAELDLEDTASAADIRARYSEYVRRFHPDSNGGDRSMEEKLGRVIRAWKTLKEAGLTKD